MAKYDEKELDTKAKELLARIKKLDPEAAQYFIDKLSSDEDLQPSLIRDLKKELAEVEERSKGGGKDSDDGKDAEKRKGKSVGIFDGWDL